MSPNTSEWPSGVTQIDVDDLEWLGIDKGRALYWDGKPIEVRKTVSLSGAQTLGAIVVGAFAILGGLGAFATGVKDASEYACQRSWFGGWTCATAEKPELPPAHATVCSPSKALAQPAGRGPR